VAELESRVGANFQEVNLTTRTPAVQRAFDVAFKAAESDATILILGESGTGKSMLARAIHQRSLRAQGAFVTVSCPSLSRELLESELFGHAKGAFTGAHAETLGKVAAADGGTLFLDEIGELPVEIQSKLLRLLQEREYERVGETKSHRSNVRVIAATNRNLQEAVTGGKFREDLFYRLNVISVTLPPLRERAADIEDLVNGQLQFFAAHAGKKTRTLSPAALDQMKHYHWPGNIRELRNVIERAVILSAGEQIEPADIGETTQNGSDIRLGGKISLTEIEHEHIRRVVENTKTFAEAAEILGIDPATLFRKRKKQG
jgi:NtrC-family two-component system response regulator AlgB